MRRANILKPQNTFQVKPDNQDTSAWKPKLTQKPHAVLPFEKSISTFSNEVGTTQYAYTIFLLYTGSFPSLEWQAPFVPSPRAGGVQKSIAAGNEH